jgi:tetratricopeptide (TPR) repeat protein
VLLLALELFLLHRTLDLGRRGAVYGLIPLFLVWANLDDSFLIGLLIVAAGVIGRAWPREPAAGAANPLPMSRGLAILGACVAVCLVNPSMYRIFPAAMEPMMPPLRLSLFSFGRGVGSQAVLGKAWVIPVLYLLAVGLGLGSFLLNRRRFSPSRFAMFAVMALLWGANILFRPEFALLFAVTLALNGQEWYLDHFGTLGRLGRGWSLWSVGGRAVTIVLVFAFVAMALTGWGKSPGEPIFGFGYNPDVYAFEVADFLKTANIDGRVLNTTREQGDALVWRAYPHRKSFIDSRSHLFPPALSEKLQQARVALSKDDVKAWKPLLDEYGISTVMIGEPSSPKTYQLLLQSPNWIPFYDDGSVVLFGRADAPAADLAYFRSHRLDAETLAYHSSRTIPPFDRPPTPMTWVDRIFRNRSLLEPQPHSTAALHWLQGHGINDHSETGGIPDPAHCFLAIQEARIALARRPDDPYPYRLLSEAYRILMIEESALLNGLKLTPENATAISRTEPRTALLMNRFRQRATALNNAIQTTPYPVTEPERQALFTLNYQLFQLYMSVHYLDLARDRLQAMLDLAPTELKPEDLTNFQHQLIELNGKIKQIQDQLNDLTIEQQLGPLQRANVARSQGAPGLAIVELEEAERTGVSPAQVRPQLVDLYCDIGQPDKALELLNTGNPEDPSLGSEPGAPANRQARVNFLLGNYEYASQLWENRAITQIAHDRGARAFAAALAMLRGQVKTATSMFLDLPGKIAIQASWDLDLALCRLESGKPDLAASPLTEALTLAPDMALRPVAAYYLEKLGKPVPPPSTAKAEATSHEKPAAKPAEDEKPSTKKETSDPEKSPPP